MCRDTFRLGLSTVESLEYVYIHTYFAWRTFVVRGDIKESRLGVLLITDENCCELGLLAGGRVYNMQ